MEKLKRFLAVTAVLITIIAGGFFISSIRINQSPDPQPPIPNVVWQLEYLIVNGKMEELRPGPFRQIQITFEDEIGDFEIKGSDGCNSFRGSLDYSPQNAVFKIHSFQQTVLECVRVQNDTEESIQFIGDGITFDAALGWMERYQLINDQLILYSANSKNGLGFSVSTVEFDWKYLPP